MPKTEVSRARVAINKINKEIAKIPKYKGFHKNAPKPNEVAMPTSHNFIEATSNAITAARRGIRMLRGREGEQSLLNRRKKLQDAMEEAIELKETVFMRDPESMKNASGFEKMTGETRAAFLARRKKERSSK